ncbi:hypothetical protein EZJ19_13490 [Parasulfuritortus cantonensis]|uniref:Uncharacterized protein n=1 Tax=Parasulfuritortus cantonensis TaxID=2528202 RepID=A0A4R1B2C4_9PROT|nr:hypothetical protein [Parasulfuritortus cantonensis]TCJ11971.1 hypothetical protein EZJ19_13490 [Parasulfuritortus cantonensis]
MPLPSRPLARRLFLAAALLAPGAGAAAAEATPAPADFSPYVARLVGNLCPAFVAQIADKPAIAPMLRRRPIDVADVCACTERGFLADGRLRSEFARPPEQVAENMKTDNLRAYFTMRLLQATMACLAAEFSDILADNDPARR